MMSFAEALPLLMSRKLLSRHSWGSKQSIFIAQPFFDPSVTPLDSVLAGSVPLVPTIIHHTEAGYMTAWVPTQDDLFARDWLSVSARGEDTPEVTSGSKPPPLMLVTKGFEHNAMMGDRGNK